MIDFSFKIIDYLKLKIVDFKIQNKRGKITFSCPYPHKWGENISAELINSEEISKFYCCVCGKKSTIFDLIRFLELDKDVWTDAKITEYLIDLLNLDSYKELKEYKKYGWALLPLAKNTKDVPLEDYKDKPGHYEKVDWIRWLNSGLNIAIRTGEVSKLTAVDVDNKPLNDLSEEQKKLRIEIINELHLSQTLNQTSPHKGVHYIFQEIKELSTGVNLGGLHIDIRNHNNYLVVQPSMFDNLEYKWNNLGEEIKIIPENIKQKLLSLKSISINNNFNKKELSTENGVAIVKEGDGRNSLLTSLGGIISKIVDIEKCVNLMCLINNTFFNPPLEKHEIVAMAGSLDIYRRTDDETVKEAIFNYIKQMEADVRAEDIVNSLYAGDRTKRAIVDKYLSKFFLEGKIIKDGFARYRYRKQVEWTDAPTEEIIQYPYKIPYFDHISYFESEILLIGAQSNYGKTTVSMNILKHMISQGVKPYYLYTQSGSRYEKISKVLNIEGKYFRFDCPDPMSIEIEPDSFTIIDWLDLSQYGFEKCNNIFRSLNTEVKKKKCFLVVLTQLKKDDGWFSPNLVEQYPAFAAKFIKDSADGINSHFDCVKIKEPKGNHLTYRIEVIYNWATKEVKLKNEI
ncbi:MAG: bifunctional DNA primase/polymerase [Patescibacteria group bacterium]